MIVKNAETNKQYHTSPTNCLLKVSENSWLSILDWLGILNPRSGLSGNVR